MTKVDSTIDEPLFNLCHLVRPCETCVRRGRTANCVDGVRKRAKYLENSTIHGAASAWPDDNQSRLQKGGMPFIKGVQVHNKTAKVSVPQSRSAEDLLSQVTPFDYSASYATMLDMMKLKLSDEGMVRVLRALSSIHPPTIFQLRALTENDRLLREYSIHRSICELSHALPLTAAPHCVFRRTGEILYVTPEFTFLTRWTAEQLQGRRVFETFWEEHGIVGFWEGLAASVGDRAVAARGFRVDAAMCGPDGMHLLGAWWITVRRDIFDIPLLIVGCFLPQMWASR